MGKGGEGEAYFILIFLSSKTLLKNVTCLCFYSEAASRPVPVVGGEGTLGGIGVDALADGRRRDGAQQGGPLGLALCHREGGEETQRAAQLHIV